MEMITLELPLDNSMRLPLIIRYVQMTNCDIYVLSRDAVRPLGELCHPNDLIQELVESTHAQ